MKLRTQDLNLGSIGLGCLQLETMTDEAAVTLITEAYKVGVNLFDTAAAYGLDRRNERLLGKAIKQIRNDECQKADPIFSTKCGINFSTMGYEGSPEQIRESVQRSLQELDVDVIPILYLHRIDPKATREELEATFKTLQELVEEGKVKHIGLSEPTAKQIHIVDEIFQNSEKLPEKPFKFVQSACSIATTRAFKNGVYHACEEKGIQFVSYTSVVRGLVDTRLSEAISIYELDSLTPVDIIIKIKEKLETPKDDFRFFSGFFEPSVIKTNMECILRFQTLAKEWDKDPSQLALAWQVSQGLLPIPGTTNLEHLKQNLEAGNIVLSKNAINEIDNCFKSFIGSPNPPGCQLDNDDLEIIISNNDNDLFYQQSTAKTKIHEK